MPADPQEAHAAQSDIATRPAMTGMRIGSSSVPIRSGSVGGGVHWLRPEPGSSSGASSDYYADSAAPRTHQRTTRLAGASHRHTGAHGALPTFTMIRLTGSATGCTATAHPRGHRSVPAATDHEHRP